MQVFQNCHKKHVDIDKGRKSRASTTVEQLPAHEIYISYVLFSGRSAVFQRTSS